MKMITPHFIKPLLSVQSMWNNLLTYSQLKLFVNLMFYEPHTVLNYSWMIESSVRCKWNLLI